MMGVATKVNFETVQTVFTDTLRGTRQGRALGALEHISAELNLGFSILLE